MKEKLKGIDNELVFVTEFNGRKIKELNPLCRGLIDDLFENVSEDAIIKSWRNHYPQKTDIFIKVNSQMRGISIKMGSRNSVHLEPISLFINFLKEIGIEKAIIEKYLYYHFADGTTNGTGQIRVSKEEYVKYHQEDIDIIN